QPENTPTADRAYVGCLGDGQLDSLARRAIARLAHFEDLDALARHPIREVYLLAKVAGRTAAFDEGTDRPAYACPLELSERHSSQTSPAIAAKAAIPPPAENGDKLRRWDRDRASGLLQLAPSTMRRSRSTALPSTRSACWYAALSCAAMACVTLSNSMRPTRSWSPPS